MDPVNEELLRNFCESATALDRDNVNGKTVAAKMGLDFEDYIRAVERLIDAGYVESNTGMLTSVIITPAGFAHAKRITPR